MRAGSHPIHSGRKPRNGSYSPDKSRWIRRPQQQTSCTPLVPSATSPKGRATMAKGWSRMRGNCAPWNASSEVPPEGAEVPSERLRGDHLPCVRKEEGTSAGMESGSGPQPWTAAARNACARWRKLDGLPPRLQRWNRPRLATTSIPRCHRHAWNRVSSRRRSGRWAMRRERMQGDARDADVGLARASMTPQGMASGARALGSRRRPRRRGSHAPPGSARRSRTRRRAAGNQMHTHREVRKLRNAETILGIIRQRFQRTSRFLESHLTSKES
jgi:hypothetical protein